MSDIRINVGANTEDAKKSFANLGKNIDDIQKKANNFSVNSTDSKLNVGPEFASKDANSDLIDAIKQLTKNLSNIKPPNEPVKLDQERLFGNLTKGGALIGAARSGYSFVKGGASSAAMYEKQALDTYNRLGIYGSDFNRARKGATNLGKEYGFDTNQVIGLQDTLLQGGLIGKYDLQESTKSMMETSLAFGINANSLGSEYANLRKRGLYGVDAERYTNTIGTNIAATGMKGREDEVARSLADITDIITNGKLEVNSSDFEMAASLQAQLAKQNPSLKGDKGAELLNKIQGGFNSGDYMTQRMFGMGNQLGYGLEGLKQAKKLAEEGLSNPEGMKIFYENLKRETGGNGTLQELYLSQTMGTKISESEEILKLLESGTAESYKKIKEKYGEGGEKQANIDAARGSKAFTNTQYELNKEAASLDVGNKLNETTGILKDIYNAMPGVAQGATSLAGATVAGAVGGSVIGSIPKLLFGGEGGNLLKGLGAGNLGKAGSFIGKNAGKFGKVAGGIGLGITALGYGSEAYGHFKEGNNREGFGSIGAGIGTIGGGLGGAKLGALAGTAILPGVGTAIGGALGGIAGAFLGDKAGRGVGRSLVGNKAYASEAHTDKKNKDLVGRQETVVKREEQLLDRLEAGDLFNINVDTDKKVGPQTKSNYKPSTGSSYNQLRNDYAQARMSGAIGGPVTGSLSGNNNTEKIWKYFKKQGFSDAGVSGIMANLYHESGLESSRLQNGGGPGRGLAQWEGPRFTALQEFARGRSKSWTDLPTQLDFLMHEMKTNHSSGFIDYFRNIDSASKAAAKFENEFERPAVNHNAERGSTAEQFFNDYRYKFVSAAKNKGKANISSYAIGNDRIAENQLAFLHKDEAVLNKFEAKAYRENQDISQASGGTINVNLNVTGGSDEELLEKCKKMLMLAINQLNNKGQNIRVNQAYQRVPG
ncbi:phage tail tip lysozyme [uncultured Anaerococcus sp.]|uniref:phage tail tip lysozyme n=1 Tax=uncultured Anaerococcus sp. TaxID=293428 RepID=UPI00280B1A0F|nr:phage tail tip lysozyme [uncultured Anaerococcus sp.]